MKVFRGKVTTPRLEQKDQRLAQEASQEAARRKSIEKELEWVRQGTKGRQSKGKARLARFEELNSTEYQKRNETNELFIPPDRVWAIKCWKSATCVNPMVIVC